MLLSLRVHLGLSLEVEGEDVFSASRLALANQEDAVARRAAGQHQLGGFETGQSAVEPLALAERVFHRLGGGHIQEQEGAWMKTISTCWYFRDGTWSLFITV